MPELPDVVVYLEHVERVAKGHQVEQVHLPSPFVLRSVDPPPAELVGRTLRGTRRIGKRLVLDFGDGICAVIHLMIAGRLHWLARGKKLNARRTQFAFEFDNGILQLTEAGTKRRASLHLVRGGDGALAAFDPGGLEVLADDDSTCSLADFAGRIRHENHTLKRTLTDPRLLSGIGGAYADEIMHRARLSPVAMTQKLADDELARLHQASIDVLREWVQRLRDQYGDSFPEGVTAFRPEMAVHGRFGQPCPVCATSVQRIVYADRETNYCPHCQTAGKLLADRALSRLLKGDWPKTLDELESLRRPDPKE